MVFTLQQQILKLENILKSQEGEKELNFVTLIEKKSRGKIIIIKRICLPKCKVKLHEIWLIFDLTVSKYIRLQQVIASSFRLDNEFSLQAALL